MPEPAVTDRATIAAHLAAFGWANVRSLYQAWRSAITAIETEEAALRWKVNDDYPGPAQYPRPEGISGKCYSPRNLQRVKRWRTPSPRNSCHR
jgi:hypothetical protein